MLIEESTHHDLEVISVAKQVAKLIEPQLSLRLKRRDGDAWLAALNERRTRRLEKRGKHAIPVEDLFDARAVLEALVWDEVGRGLLTVEARRAADNLHRLATLAAHQRPQVRRPEAAERAHALGVHVLRAVGIPESALLGTSTRDKTAAASPQKEPAKPEVRRASAGSLLQASPRRPAKDQVGEEADAPEEASLRALPMDPAEPPRKAAHELLPRPVPPASAQLAWRLGPEVEELVLLEPGGRPYFVGRDVDCDVLLETDLGASRRHAQISFEDGGWWLTDLGSKNGTRVAGAQISTRGRLSDGVIVRIGRTDLRFELLH